MNAVCGFDALNEASRASESRCALAQHKTEAGQKETTSEEESEEEECLDPRVLQEESLRAYNEALTLYGAAKGEGNKVDEAVRAFARTLETPLLSSKRFRDRDASARLLRYNALKYYGFGLGELGRHREAADALFMAATELKAEAETDVNLFFRLGAESVKAKQENRLPVARRAFEQALAANPEHWPSLEMACSLTYRTGDLISCLTYCEPLLRKGQHERISKLASSIVSSEPHLRWLCPSLKTEEAGVKATKSPTFKVHFVAPGPPEPPLFTREDTDLTLSLSFNCWSQFFEQLVFEQRQSQERLNKLPPSRIFIEYKEAPPQLQDESVLDGQPPRDRKEEATQPEKSSKEKEESPMEVSHSQDSHYLIEVSVQNIVNEIIDLVSVGTGRVFAETVVNEIIDATVFGSSKTIVSCILDDVRVFQFSDSFYGSFLVSSLSCRF